MKCETFLKTWIELNSEELEQLDTSSKVELFEHMNDCDSCREESSRLDLAKRGVNLEEYPCHHMASWANFECEDHSNPNDCHDYFIQYNEKFDEYSIPHRDGVSFISISFCPWCGVGLPESKRDLWFEKLELLGFDDPSEQKIPKEFHSKKWREGL